MIVYQTHLVAMDRALTGARPLVLIPATHAAYIDALLAAWQQGYGTRRSARRVTPHWPYAADHAERIEADARLIEAGVQLWPSRALDTARDVQRRLWWAPQLPLMWRDERVCEELVGFVQSLETGQTGPLHILLCAESAPQSLAPWVQPLALDVPAFDAGPAERSYACRVLHSLHPHGPKLRELMRREGRLGLLHEALRGLSADALCQAMERLHDRFEPMLSLSDQWDLLQESLLETPARPAPRGGEGEDEAVPRDPLWEQTWREVLLARQAGGRRAPKRELQAVELVAEPCPDDALSEPSEVCTDEPSEVCTDEPSEPCPDDALSEPSEPSAVERDGTQPDDEDEAAHVEADAALIPPRSAVRVPWLDPRHVFTDAHAKRIVPSYDVFLSSQSEPLPVVAAALAPPTPERGDEEASASAPALERLPAMSQALWRLMSGQSLWLRSEQDRMGYGVMRDAYACQGRARRGQLLVEGRIYDFALTWQADGIWLDVIHLFPSARRLDERGGFWLHGTQWRCAPDPSRQRLTMSALLAPEMRDRTLRFGWRDKTYAFLFDAERASCLLLQEEPCTPRLVALFAWTRAQDALSLTPHGAWRPSPELPFVLRFDILETPRGVMLKLLYRQRSGQLQSAIWGADKLAGNASAALAL